MNKIKHFCLVEGKFRSVMAYTYTALAESFLYVVVGTTIFRMHLGVERWEKLGFIPVQYQKRTGFDRCIAIYNDKLLFWNFDMGRGYTFDVNEGTGKEIVFDTEGSELSDGPEAYIIVESERKLLFLPSISDKLWVYWKDSGRYEVHTQWKRCLGKKIDSKGLRFKCIRHQDITVQNERFYVIIGTDGPDLAAEFEIGNLESVELIDMNYVGKSFGILRQGDSLYFQNMTDRENRLVRWTKEKAEYFWDLDGETVRGNLYVLNEKITLILRNGNIYVLNTEQNELQKETVAQGIISSHGLVVGGTKEVLFNNDGIALWDVQNNTCRQFPIPWLDFFLALTATGGIYEL